MRSPTVILLAALAPFAFPGEAARAVSDAPAPLTLDEALELAARGNEIPGIAAARLERAEALRRQAVSALLPSLTLSGTYTRRAREIIRDIGGDRVTVQALDAFSGQAVGETTLFDLRALPLLRSATRGVAAQRLESAELERALAHDVAAGFYLVLGAEQLRGAAEERVRVARRTFEEAELRVEAGLAGRNDATRAGLELATARLAETRAASDVVTARLSLAYLVGAPVEERPLVEPAEVPAVALENLEARDRLVERALAARADVAALAERAEQARQLARAPRYAALPRLDARGIFRHTNEAGLSGREEDWNVALNLTWELWDGGDRAAVAAQRDSEALEAELQLARRRREIALEVADADAALATAEAAVEQAAVRVAAARDNAFEIRERYSNGLATALELADAAVEEFEAEAELVRQRYARSLSLLALGRALGDWPGGTRRVAPAAPPASAATASGAPGPPTFEATTP
jgi:outer membrane protein